MPINVTDNSIHLHDKWLNSSGLILSENELNNVLINNDKVNSKIYIYDDQNNIRPYLVIIKSLN